MAEKMPYINRPFYKYCYVCEGASRKEDTVDYYINNFENDELFFQNPTLFNDPFDCFFGFSQKDLLKEALITAMKQQNRFTSEMSKAINTFFSSEESGVGSDGAFDDDNIRNNIQTLVPLVVNTLTKDPDEKEGLIKQLNLLILDENIHLLKKMAQNQLTVSDQQKMIDLLFSDDSLKEKMKSKIENIADGESIIEITKRALKLRVETTPNMFFAGNESESSQMFDMLTMMIKSITDKPEPPELREVRNQLSQLGSKTMMKYRDWMSDRFKIACLSERMDSPLMWSHYANKHFGFCLEYDFTHTIIKNYPDLDDAKIMLLPVIYSEKRPLLPQVLTSPVLLESFVKGQAVPDSLTEDIMYGLLFKSEEWAYEREWRIIGINMGKAVMKLPSARKVFLGANMEKPIKEKIVAIAKKKHIPVYQMYLSPDKYKFEYVEVSLQ